MNTLMCPALLDASSMPPFLFSWSYCFYTLTIIVFMLKRRSLKLRLDLQTQTHTVSQVWIMVQHSWHLHLQGTEAARFEQSWELTCSDLSQSTGIFSAVRIVLWHWDAHGWETAFITTVPSTQEQFLVLSVSIQCSQQL